MFANPGLSVVAGDGLAGGVRWRWAGMVTLTVDPTKVPVLASANTFAATQTINNGNLALANGSLALPDSTNPMITVRGQPFLNHPARTSITTPFWAIAPASSTK